MLSRLILTIVAFISITGCEEVTITNGHVPKEHLAQAKKLEGVYKGSFEGSYGQLEVRFNGDQPQLLFTNGSDNEFLKNSENKPCHAKFGLLKSVQISDSGDSFIVDQATFEFLPGACPEIKGRTVQLSFNGQREFDMSILYYTTYENNCYPSPPPPYGPGRRCDLVEKPVYLNGLFQR